ncbi:glycosyl transferase [Leptolyngbya sp. 'hensonii']|uniref:glycosyltransferase family 4 protein n=1 Tax=Leptolyngbya sp. 'hensonii' TaxID=1922337 RepID=UPI0009503166|nr:glycosyltransferase family 4 protein [Leptolyngbya sp. 'hensonii']OLP18915.1 glycosyl transferase [Leptolyngbya sp. 'hensonii']
MLKLAIITSHPIQYYAPWFRYLAQQRDLSIRVFYLWDFGVTQQVDREFQQSFQWDIPLLSGYDFEFVPNVSQHPGTQNIWGLQNPTLMQQIRQYGPDAILLMNYNFASLYRLMWSWKETPLLFRGDSHRLLPQQGLKAWARRQWISRVYQQFAACLYVGEANRGYFRYHGVPDDRLFFSPHAIETDRFFAQSKVATQEAQRWKQELGIPAHHQVILFAGKFILKKRPLDLLQAFLRANLTDVSLLLVGSGNLESELRTQAAHHPQVYFAPFQNQSLMPRTYAIADLFVLPSYGPDETWGLAVNEAMCLGKPILVSDHVGCAADLVHPNQNGLIFPAGDRAALADRLREAFADRARLQVWGESSRERIQQYSYAQATAGLMQALSWTQTQFSKF